MKKILIDTNAYTALLSGDESVLDALAQAEQVFISAIVLGELFAGFKGGSREHRNRQLLEEFLQRPPVRTLDVSRETAEVFGEVKQQLKKDGTPLPINDVWIAAHSIEQGAWLVTFDHHFLEVGRLLLWDGLEP